MMNFGDVGGNVTAWIDNTSYSFHNTITTTNTNSHNTAGNRGNNGLALALVALAALPFAVVLAPFWLLWQADKRLFPDHNSGTKYLEVK